MQLSRETFKLLFTVPVKSSGDISAEPVRGQKIEEHVFTDLDLRNDEYRPAVQQQKNVKKYHRKTRLMRWLTLSLEATISVYGHPIHRKKCRNIG